MEKTELSNNKEIVYLRGKLYWAKVLGDPVDNYNKDGKEWTFDLALDADGVKQAKQHKELTLKDKDDDRGKFISLKQKLREDSGRSVDEQRIRIVDAAGHPWNQKEKIGNGSVADVKFEIRSYGPGKYPGIYPRAIRILEHVSYEAQEFAPISEDDEYASAAKAADEDWSSYKVDDKEFAKDFGLETSDTDDGDLDDDLPV